MEFTRDNLEKLLVLRIATCAKNRSRQMTCEYAIIVILQGDSEVPRIQIVIYITKILIAVP